MATHFHQWQSKSWLRPGLWGTVGWSNNSHESTGFSTRLDELSHNVSSARGEPAVNDPQYFTAAWRSQGCLYGCLSVYADSIYVFLCGKTGNQPAHQPVYCWSCWLFFPWLCGHVAVTLKIARHPAVVVNINAQISFTFTHKRLWVKKSKFKSHLLRAAFNLWHLLSFNVLYNLILVHVKCLQSLTDKMYNYYYGDPTHSPETQRDPKIEFK